MRDEKPHPQPPHQIELEQATIGCILVSPASAKDAITSLKKEDFFDPIHQIIFAHATQLLSEGRAPTLMQLVPLVAGIDVVPERLTCGQYLGRLAVNAGDPALLSDYVAQLRQLTTRRRMIATATALGAAAWQPTVDIRESIAAAMSDIDSTLADLRQHRRLVYDGGGAAEIISEHIATVDRAAPTTGLIDLDAMIGGWPIGQLSVMAGRPGMGKSAVATSSMLHAAKAGVHCMFFSLEMTGPQIGARLICDLAYTAQNPLYYESLLHRKVGDGDLRKIEVAAETLRALPVRIEEQRGLTVAEVSARATRYANELTRAGSKLGIVFVDHMLLLKASERYSGNRVREVAEISDGLATLAKDIDTSVVALCQLNRGVEGRDNKRPSLADLRDSGAIEEDASAVIFAYRPAYYLERERHDDADRESARLEMLDRVRTLLELQVAKNRNGRVGNVMAYCDIGANAVRNGSYGR